MTFKKEHFTEELPENNIGKQTKTRDDAYCRRISLQGISDSKRFRL